MLAEIKPYLDWLQANPQWGGLIAGLIALSESLVVVGLLIPGTVMMTALGTLIGAGILPFTSTTLWAIAGAIIGDVFSYWLGYHYHQHLKDFWPFRTHPKILAKGEEFFVSHGRKGIFLGRFLGPIRPILPAIAGMMSMPPKRFLLADISSAIVWAPAYMLPGILLGAASQELPPEIATKLILSVVAALLVFWWLSWIFKKVYAWFIGLLDRLVAWLWKFTANHPHLKVFSNFLLDPSEPHNHNQLALTLLLLLATLSFVVLACSVVHHGWLTTLNDPVYFFMRSLRSTPIDNIFISITLLGNPFVYFTFWIAVFVWLAYRRYWHAAWHWLGVGILVIASTEFIKYWLHLPRPPGLLKTPPGWSFPSGHSALGIAFFGFFAVLLIRMRANHWRWIAYSCAALLIGAIMLSRLYLGAHWLTDVIGGGLLGMICVLLMTISYRRLEHSAIAPTGILIIGFLSLTLSFAWILHHDFSKSIRNYTPYWSNQIIDKQAWWSHKTDQIPLYRINRFGKPIELMNVEWAGNLFEIKEKMYEKGWRLLPKASLSTLIGGLAGTSNEDQILIMSQFFEDRKPVLVMTKHIPDLHAVLVLRLWNAHLMLNNDQPLWLGTITYHRIWSVSLTKMPKKSNTSHLPTPTDVLINDLKEFTYQKENRPDIHNQQKPILFIKNK